MATSDEMGAYSHDQIQHPLLWCDEKKRLVERKNAEESLRMWRRRKAEECARKEKDKQEYYDLFLQHYPWGRPGGGAPNVEVRRKDITAVGLHSTPTDTSAHRASLLHPFQYNDYFSVQKSCLKNPLSTCSHHQHPPAPGGRLTHSTHHLQESGLRSSTVTICEREHPFKKGVVQAYRKNSDSLHIDLKEHPSMSNRNKGQVDIELRFIPPPPCKVKPVLEKVVLKSETEHPVQEKFGCQKKKLQANCEKPLLKEPWGKAGPGGKPWRSPKEVGSTFMKSMGWTNKEMLKDLDQDNPVTPAEKNTFSNLNCGKPIKLQCCGEACTCSCPVLNSSSLLKPSKRITAVVLPASECGKRSSLKECKPLKVCPRKQRSHFTSSTGNSTATPDAVLESEGGGVELVPLLARRRGLHCPISLSSTDVTKRKPSHDRIQTVTYMRYLHDLNLQISQKRHSSCVARQMDRELCNQHFNTFETFWGRPGHGAPSGYKINKLRLDELLYGTASEKQ